MHAFVRRSKAGGNGRVLCIDVLPLTMRSRSWLAALDDFPQLVEPRSGVI